MFKTGDFIVYGSNGVCQVESVGTLTSIGLPKDKVYYTLRPNDTQTSKIFTPTDNKKVLMRSVLTKDEAVRLIDEVEEIDCLTIENEKGKERIFKEVFHSCDCRELVKLIKTIYLRKFEREAEGKKVAAGDDKFLEKAEEYLYGELAIPLKKDVETVKELVISRLGIPDNTSELE